MKERLSNFFKSKNENFNRDKSLLITRRKFLFQAIPLISTGVATTNLLKACQDGNTVTKENSRSEFTFCNRAPEEIIKLIIDDYNKNNPKRITEKNVVPIDLVKINPEFNGDNYAVFQVKSDDVTYINTNSLIGQCIVVTADNLKPGHCLLTQVYTEKGNHLVKIDVGSFGNTNDVKGVRIYYIDTSI